MINKIVHLSDIHIRKIPTRNDEYEKVFNNLIESVKNKKPDRIVIVGDLVHDYLDLQGEQIILATKLLNNLVKIAPIRITRGNHDCRKKSLKRVDSIAAIVEVIDNPNIVYYNKTGFYTDDNIIWAVWHHGEPKNNPWKKRDVKNLDHNNKIIIDLFHDPINGCKTVTGFDMKNKSYYKLKDLKGDFSFLGDIHLQQYFDNSKKAYSGSLIAQNFFEGDDKFHGYLLWEIGSYNDNGEFSVEKIEIPNDYSFKNIKLTPFTDFDELDLEIENPTSIMKGRIIWSTLPSARNNDNERKIIEYLKSKYSNITISHTNEFIEDDNIEVDEDISLENIVSQDVQHEIFKNYLEKIGIDEDIINNIIDLDVEITSKLTLDEITNIEWSIVRFGGENFMSYEEIEIDWRDMDGLYQISGINTAGKTTILKLISYLLFGKTLETETRVKFGDSRFINNKNNNDFCDGYLILEANGEYFGIKRRTDIERKKDGEIKGAPTKITYHKLSSPDDEMNDTTSLDSLNEDDRIKTQQKIEEIIGSYDNFMRVVMTTSDTLNRILSNDMSIFIDSLLYDSGLDIFDKKLTEVKEYAKEINKKSRITCDVEFTNEKIKRIENENEILDKELSEIETIKILDVDDRIKRGNEYIIMLTKKQYKIDPEIQNLNIKDVNEEIDEHNKNISELEKRKKLLEDNIKQLKESYDSKRLEELELKKDEHKTQEYNSNLSIKEIERNIADEEHLIEILNGKIHTLKENGKNKREEINKLKESKVCPTCGQEMTEDHRKHIDEIIDGEKKKMYEFADEIKKHEEKIIKTHKIAINNFNIKINEINDEKEKMSLKMEDILKEIGQINNDKNDVEKRKEYQNELDNIPIKKQNEKLIINSLQQKIDNYENSLKQIEENKILDEKIIKAKKRLQELNIEKSELNETLLIKKTKVHENIINIEQNKQLILDFKEQEHRDKVIDLYKKCVHRDGIPRQLLTNNIIPKINRELEKILSSMPFKIWFDIDDLRPKLAYTNTPNAIIDAISSSGKERTFASIVIKFALNQINVKSKPTIFLLDEIMGKLSEESVEEFIEILQVIKNKVKKFLIIEHNHEVNPDYVIDVIRDNKGISKAIIR